MTRLIDLAALTYTADTISKSPRRIGRFLLWMVLAALAIPGLLMLALIPYAQTPSSLVVLAFPLLLPGLIGLAWRPSMSRIFRQGPRH